MALTESADVIVRILERKSNRVVAELSSWESVNFTSRWRKAGHGQLVALADDVPADALALLPVGNMTIQVIREWYRGRSDGSEVKVTERYEGPVGKYRFDKASEKLTFSLADNLIYPTERITKTSGVANIDPGVVVAGTYIETMLNDQLLAPSDADRTIDVSATFAGGAAQGEQVDLPVRWKYLSDVIEQACIAGEVGIIAPITSGQIAFEVKPVNDRTTGGVDSVILSAENTGANLVYSQDDRAVRNRVYVLGANEAAARDVRVVTAADFSTGDRLREVVVDARHLSTNDEYDARGNAELSEKGESQRTIEVTEVDREFDIRPGDKVTLEEYLRTGSKSPEIGPVDVLCLARSVSLRPGQVDRVMLEIGSEVPTSALILKAVDRRGEAARYV